MSLNQHNIEHWNSPLSRRWVSEQERLDRVYGQLDDVAIARAAPRVGEQVIDVGCGCGASALRIAELVGASGAVLGVDVSRMMLERARERARPYPQIALCEADVTEHAFAGDADLVYSRLGVMFFAEPEVAFANLRRALRPGGRLCVVCWRTPEENPWYSVPLRAAGHLLPPPAPVPPGASGPFSLAKRERLHAVLQAAGYSEIALDPHDVALRLSNEGLDEAVDYSLVAGPLARAMTAAQSGDDVITEIRAAVRAVLADYVDGETVALAAGFWIANARA